MCARWIISNEDVHVPYGYAAHTDRGVLTMPAFAKKGRQ